MSSIFSAKPSTIFIIIILFFSSPFIPIINSQQFSRELHKNSLHLNHHQEKLTHLHFYFHDILSGGRNATAVRIAQAATTNSSATLFGVVNIADDPLTVGPELSSGLVGRAQGMYASADRTTAALMMVFNFYFTEGKYNGSTLSMLGRNAVFDHVRELPIVGGSGCFRFARGYALARTYEFDLQTGDAIVEYNIYVWHYRC